MVKKTSWLWYLLPILFGIFGGIIGYLLLKEDDPKKAKNVLIIGFVMLAISILLSVFRVISFINFISPSMSLMQ